MHVPHVQPGEAEVHRNFYRLRQTLGYLGFFLPIILSVLGALAWGDIRPSISNYYHTLMRDVFVGVLTAIGVFLICYTGYKPASDERISDRRLTSLAGWGAIGVAFFPDRTVMPEPLEAFPQLFGHGLTAGLHYLSAILFFVALGVMSYAKFARTGDKRLKPWFRALGLVVLAMALGIALLFLAKQFLGFGPMIEDYDLVFWAESLGVWAFSIAWLLKGEADRKLPRAVQSVFRTDVLA